MNWVPREMSAPEQDTLTATEAANLLGVDVKTLRRMVSRGEFPQPVQANGRPSWLWEDLVWYRLTLRMQPRLRPHPVEPGGGTNRDKQGQSRSKADS